MSRLVRRPPVLFSFALLVLALPFVARAAWRYAAAAPLPAQQAPRLEPTLLRAGLSPTALASAQVSSGQVATIVADFQDAIAAAPARLVDADAEYAVLRASTDALRRKVQGGKATPEEVADYQSQMAALGAAETERAAAIDELFTAAAASLDAGQVATLRRIHANRTWELPIHYSVADRSEPDWVLLRDALSNEKITARYGEPADPGLEGFLTTTRSDPAVAAAKSSLDTNLSAVESAWQSAVGD